MSYRKPGFALGSRPMPSSDGPATDAAPPPGLNARTRTMAAHDPHAPVGAMRAFAAVHPFLHAAAADGPGLLVSVVGPTGVVVAQDLLRPHDSATIGRHTECRIQVTSPDVSLRHLHAQVLPSATGVRVRVWDLQTGQPFRTEDGAQASAVVADGPLFITLGSYTFAFLATVPQVAEHPDEAWADLPPREFAAKNHSVVAAAAVARPTGEEKVKAARTAPITRIPAPTSLVSSHVPPHLRFARLTIEAQGRRLAHDVSLDDLRRGVLVGRYDRCQLGQVCETTVSRVHLLVVAVDDRIYAFDTASTNGTEYDGVRVASVRLGRSETLELGGETRLSWQTLARAAA